jgi:hypothetical protein
MHSATLRSLLRSRVGRWPTSGVACSGSNYRAYGRGICETCLLLSESVNYASFCLLNSISLSAFCFKLTVRVASLGETLRAFTVNDLADRSRPDKRESDYPASRLSGHSNMVALMAVVASGDCTSSIARKSWARQTRAGMRDAHPSHDQRMDAMQTENDAAGEKSRLAMQRGLF